MAAGIDPHDTQSAVEFLTREEYFDQFAKQAKDWTSKNFQLVIRTSIPDILRVIPNSSATKPGIESASHVGTLDQSASRAQPKTNISG